MITLKSLLFERPSFSEKLKIKDVNYLVSLNYP